MQAGKDAIVRVDGRTVVRTSNTITDAIGGVTLSLNTAEPGTAIDVTIDRDVQGTVDSVQKFADSYNQIRKFYDEQRVADAPLASDTRLRSVISTFQDALRTEVPGNGTYNRLALAGLVLDKNGLRGCAGFPTMPAVTTLWCNNNAVDDLVAFLDDVARAFPGVTYLSCMRNPCSPPLVCASEDDVQATRRHRLYVVFRLPRLQFLDSSPVTAAERKEAAEKGAYLAPRRPKAAPPITMAIGATVRPARPRPKNPSPSASRPRVRAQPW
jgi:hypothetical protein